MKESKWKEGLLLETEIAILIQQQEEYGVAFDHGRAVWAVRDLENKKESLYKDIRPFLDYIIKIEEGKDKDTKEISYVKKLRNLNGSLTRSVSNFIEATGINEEDIQGPFSRISIEEPSLSKRNCVISSLYKLGWKPTIFTDGGTPKLTDEGLPVESLEKVGDFGKSLALWYTLNHRQSQIKGLIDNIRDDGRITAGMITVGTNTFRATHRIVANIPRVTSIYGGEMRALFTTTPGRKLVGADASGLELRMLAHYMNDQNYIDLILKGDVHTYNMEAANTDAIVQGTKKILDRNMSKAFCYSTLYGAGDSKTGSVVGGTSKDGKILKNSFFKNVPALGDLLKRVQGFVERNGYIPGIDGRKIYIRSFEGRYLIHTALNALLQGSGSIVVKRAMVIYLNEIKRRGLDARQVIWYHDEFVVDCEESIAEEVCLILKSSFTKAGEYYKMRIPIDSEYHIGLTWGDVH